MPCREDVNLPEWSKTQFDFLSKRELIVLSLRRMSNRGAVHAHWRLYHDVASLWLQPRRVVRTAAPGGVPSARTEFLRLRGGATRMQIEGEKAWACRFSARSDVSWPVGGSLAHSYVVLSSLSPSHAHSPGKLGRCDQDSVSALRFCGTRRDARRAMSDVSFASGFVVIARIS
jgi:hypothetical protein